MTIMTGRPLTKKDFRLKGLTKAEISIVLVHILVSLAFFTIYKFELLSPSELKGWISGYYFVVPFAVVGIFFRNLRSFSFYLLWLTISIGQLIINFMVNGLSEFSFPRGTAFSGLKALLPALVLFQLFRIFLLKSQGRELIVTMRKGRSIMWEDEDNRKMTWIEIAFSLFLIGTIVTFNAIL